MESNMKMKKKLLCLMLCAVQLLFCLCACNTSSDRDPAASGTGDTEQTEEPQEGERIEMKKRVSEWFLDALQNNRYLFSCKIDGVPFSEAAADAEKKLEQTENEKGDTLVTASYLLKNGLFFTVTATLFRDFPTVDFVVSLENRGNGRSGVVSEFYGMDASFPLSRNAAYELHTTRGCLLTGTTDDYDYEPVTQGMAKGAAYTFAPEQGRSCNAAFPFFDVIGKDCGVLVAVGWTGQWEASFSMNETGVGIKVRQQDFSAYLLKGESVRTPSVSITYFDGTPTYGHNLFRQLVLHAYTPYGSDGEMLSFPMPFGAGGSTESILSVVNNQLAAGIPVDTVWVDAGWYGTSDPNRTGDEWYQQAGNWFANSKLYPTGSMKEVGDAVHAKGLKFLLWMELERAYAGTEMVKKHPTYYYSKIGTDYLLALDREESKAWMLEQLRTAVLDWGVDVYRQDFNINPLSYWQGNDEENRDGITENHYITNLYDIYDTLRAEFPDLVIDNCASGGRRIDIEMLKRCLILWRSDYPCTDNYDDEGAIFHIQNLSYWIPLHADGIRGNIYDSYTYLCGLSVETQSPTIVSNATELKKLMTKFYDVRKYWYGDYYQLLPATYDKKSAQAYELFRPDLGEGIVVAVSRPEHVNPKCRFRIEGLDPDASYKIYEYGNPEKAKTKKGSEWMEKDYVVTLSPRSGVLLKIEKTA